MSINVLLEEKASFEVVRDQIATLLDTEQANQQALAIAEGKDPSFYGLKVFVERVAPTDAAQIWQLGEECSTDYNMPLVIVRFRDANLDSATTNNTDVRKYSGTFDVEITGAGLSEEGGTEEVPGDYVASNNLDRGIKLVEKILSFSEYKNLNIPLSQKLISNVKIQTINKNEPDRDYSGSLRVHGGNITITVEYNEFSTQKTFEDLNLITVQTNRAEDNFNLFNAEFTKGT